MDLWTDDGDPLQQFRRGLDVLITILQRRDQMWDGTHGAHRSNGGGYQDERGECAPDDHRSKPVAEASPRKSLMNRKKADCENDRPQEESDERQKQLRAQRNKQP